MEPSCLAVFKDELARVLPHDDDASAWATAPSLDEFFERFEVEVDSPDDSRSRIARGRSARRRAARAAVGTGASRCRRARGSRPSAI
jgi:hypothetical protein